MASHNEVAHNWAHKTGKAQRGFNMFYDDEIIFSYGRHFPIARHATTPDGKPCILFTTQGYSVSTSKHLSYTSRAIPSDIPVFRVYDVTAGGSSDSATNKHFHMMNRQAMIISMTSTLKTASRARQNKGWLLECAESTRQQANEYSKAFRLGFRDVPKPKNMEAMLQQFKADELKRQQLQTKRDKVKIKAWLNGETDSAPHTKTPYVRIVGDKVQTSWGITVALKPALALYRLARICKGKAQAFIPQKLHKVDGWQLNRITDDGTIKAGCHLIPFNVQTMALKAAGMI